MSLPMSPFIFRVEYRSIKRKVVDTMKRFLIMLLMALFLGSMVPHMASAKEDSDVRVEQERKEAQEKVRVFFDKYVDPNYCLEDPYYSSTKQDAKRAELHVVAEGIIKGSKTQYDKIKAITMYVANHVYYNHSDQPSYADPYEIYKNRYAVCIGYAFLVKALCDEVGLPCMTLQGTRNHIWNAAYDSEQKRWIFLDATWCSNNRYGVDNVEWSTRAADDGYFDFKPAEMTDAFHLPCEIKGIRDQKYNSVYYRLETVSEGQDWNDFNQWHLGITEMHGKSVKVVSGLAGIKVTEIYYTEFDRNARARIRTIDLSEAPITKIYGTAANACINLTSVKFPSTLTEIGASAFAGCYKLKNIDLSNTKITYIGLGAFADCYSAKIIKLPSTLKKIDMHAFAVYKKKSSVRTTLVTKLSKKQLYISKKKLRIWTGRRITNFTSTYTIRFMKNGAKKGKMSKLSCDRESKVKLPTNKFVRSGYKFKGWSTKKNGKGKIYMNRARVKNLAKANKTIKLYACWKKISKSNKM